ncbi:MAG: hypothetical protein ABR958_05090 [Dehalococcoidales bacterium]
MLEKLIARKKRDLDTIKSVGSEGARRVTDKELFQQAGIKVEKKR